MRLVVIIVLLIVVNVLMFALIAALAANRKLRSQLDDVLRARHR